jgi:hypothetical protein
MFRFAVPITAFLTSATWAAAETVDVKYYGKLESSALRLHRCLAEQLHQPSVL